MNAPLPIVVILTLSLLIQTAAAIMAVRLIYITGRQLAWILIAVALTLMAARRVLPLYRLIMGDVSLPPDPLNEVVGLVLSTAMAAGIARIAPLFLERKKAAEDFRLLIENSPIAIAISDASWNLEFLNRKFVETFGYTLEDCPHIDSWWTLAYPDPAYREQVKAEWFSKVGEAEAQGKEISPQETVVTCKDGSTKNIEFRHIAIQDRGITLFYDITERKRVEQAIQDSENRYRTLFEGAPDAVVIADLETGRIADANSMASRLIGWSHDELVGMHQSRLHPPRIAAKTSESFQEHTQAARNGKIAGPFEHIIIRSDGVEVPVEIMIQRVMMNGKTMIQGVFRDISERKRTENEISKLHKELKQRVIQRTADLEQKGQELQASQSALVNIVDDLNMKTEELERANTKLQELDRMKSMFIASMSHELRTPLNSIIGFSSIMLNEWTGPMTVEQKENLSAVLRSGKHLLSLINDVIDVSKIEAGKIESIAEDFDVHDVVMEAVETLQKEIEKKGLKLKISAPSQTLRADRRRLLQCLLNLVSNATKYTKQGSISVSAERSPDGSMMTMAVEDTGMGIREEDLVRLFSPFVRLTTPVGGTIPGTGLGLYLTKKLVQEVLRGDVSATSAYGAGSRFTLQVPMAG